MGVSTKRGGPYYDVQNIIMQKKSNTRLSIFPIKQLKQRNNLLKKLIEFKVIIIFDWKIFY